MYHNLNLIRYFLALAVVVAHYNFLAHASYPWPVDSTTAVGVFFGISGFLVCGSFEHRPDLRRFVLARIRRIFPSYYAVVLVCAFGLAFLSSLSFSDYFCDVRFWQYLLANCSFLNFLAQPLPGVFEDSVSSAVNASLWTLKVEWFLYLSIPVVFWLKKRMGCSLSALSVALIILSGIYRVVMSVIGQSTGNEIYNVLSYQFGGQMMYFYAGVLFFQHIDYLCRYRRHYLVVSALVFAMVFGADACLPPSVVLSVLLNIAGPVSMVFFFLLLGTTRPLGNWVSGIGNCSYEMYLFHFPLIQVFVSVGLIGFLPQWAAFPLLLIVLYAVSFLFCHFVYNRFAGKS